MLYHDQNHETETHYQNPQVSFIQEALVPFTSETFFKELTMPRWNISQMHCFPFPCTPSPPSN
jgi:hypothetical protein